MFNLFCNFETFKYPVHSFKNITMKNITKTIIGAIAGDVIGSIYESRNDKTTDFPLYSVNCHFTDDTVLTIAVADCILNEKDFAQTIWEYGNAYPHSGYGKMFKNWLASDNPQPYNSYGNGSAMRVSPVGFACQNMEEVLKVAAQSAEVTHNHPEGIKGAQAIAAAVFLARTGQPKQAIRDFITEKFAYDLNFTMDSIRPSYKFDATCQGSVPQAIVAFLESHDIESAIRLAISIGGDSDTIACMAGGIAMAYYKEIPRDLLGFVSSTLPYRFVRILSRFDMKCAHEK